jgi:hypothetical protein
METPISSANPAHDKLATIRNMIIPPLLCGFMKPFSGRVAAKYLHPAAGLICNLGLTKLDPSDYAKSGRVSISKLWNVCCGSN